MTLSRRVTYLLLSVVLAIIAVSTLLLVMWDKVVAYKSWGYLFTTTGIALLCALLLLVGTRDAKKKGLPLFLTRKSQLYLILLAAIYGVVINIYAYHHFQTLLLAICTTAASICLLWAIFRRFSLLFWWPFLILEIAQNAGDYEYGTRIDPLVLAEIFEASREEALAYLSTTNLCIIAAAAVVSAFLCWLMLRLLRKQHPLALINTSILCLTAAAAISAILSSSFRIYQNFGTVGEVCYLQQSCTEALFHNEATIKQAAQLPSPTMQPSTLHTLKGDEGVVLVVHIGESVRADRMSINGYERDTTPWLRSQSRLINFPHCISAAPDTCQAQIAILTDARRDIYETSPDLQPHTGSVLDLFDAHGFKIYSFFGNRHAALLKYDRVVRQLTHRSEERFYAPGSPWTSIPQISDTLRTLGDKQNTLLFINNEGSHTPFNHFDHEHPPFSPTVSDFHNPAAHAQELNNAYDATVHYTDAFIRLVTQQLQGRPWVYLYISDHGEYLGHNGIWGRAALGKNKLNYHSTTGCRVGMFILTSPELEKLHPHFAQSLENLQKHTPMTVAHEHIFHTLLGFFDLRTPYYNPALDLTSPLAQPYTGPQPHAEPQS